MLRASTTTGRLLSVLLVGLMALPPKALAERNFARKTPASAAAYASWAACPSPAWTGSLQQVFADDSMLWEFVDDPDLQRGLPVMAQFLALAARQSGAAYLRFDPEDPDDDYALVFMLDVSETEDDGAMLSDALGALLSVDGDEVQPLIVAGNDTWRLIGDADYPWFRWGVHDGALVIYAGTAEPADLLARMGETAKSLWADEGYKASARTVGAAKPKDRYAEMYFNLGMWRDVLHLLIREEGDLDAENTDALLKALGLDAMKSVHGVLRESEVGLQKHVLLRTEGERIGLLTLFDGAAITDEELKVIPANASTAAICNLDLYAVWKESLKVIEAVDPNLVVQVQGAPAMAAQFLGFSITEDLLPLLGPTWTFVDAPQHGGALWDGGVLIVDTKDAEALASLIDRCMVMAGAAATGASEGRMHVLRKSREMRGNTVNYIVLGGLPVGLTPAWGFANKRLVLGAYPQSVAAAMRQVNPGTQGPSILQHPDFEAARKTQPSAICALSYTDSRTASQRIYGWARMLWAMGQSMFSSPSGMALGDPGAFPMIDEWVKDTRNFVCVRSQSRDGIEWHCSGSIVPDLNVASIWAVALLVSILLPSLSRARELAKRTVSMSNLRTIGIGCAIYANDHNNVFPPNLETLIKESLITRDTLNCPNDIPGAISYVYVAGQKLTGNDRNVLAYERPGLHGDEGANVLFIDGHVEFMHPFGFESALRETLVRLDREDEMPSFYWPSSDDWWD